MANYNLRLIRFKKLDDFSIEFPPNGMILLDGRSGIGKTSILDALSFVLYDNAKNTPYPRTSRNSKGKPQPTIVQLTFPTIGVAEEIKGLQIYRQRRPNLLRVEGPGVQLADETAQHFLNQILGPYTGWLSGGYFKQDELCAFLSMSSKDKLTCLQELAMPDAFDQLLQKTTEKITEANSQLQQSQTGIQIYREMYMQKYNQCPVEIRESPIWQMEDIISRLNDDNLDDLSIDQLLNKLKETETKRYYLRLGKLNEDKSAEQICQTQLGENLKLRQRLETEINNLEQNLNPVSTDIIPTLELDIQQLTEQISLAQKSERRTQLLAAKSELDRRLDQLGNVEISKYNLGELDQIDRVLSGPSVEVLTSQIKMLNEAKIYGEKMTEYRKFSSMRDQKLKLETSLTQVKTSLDECPTESVGNQIEELNQKIWAANLHQKKLICPSCQEGVYLNGSQLERCPADGHGLNLSELSSQKFALQQKEDKFNQRSHLESQIKTLLEQIESLNKEIDEIGVVEEPSPLNQNPYITKSGYEIDQMKIRAEQLLDERQNVPDINVGEEREKIEKEAERSRYQRDCNLLIQELDQLGNVENESGQADELTQLRSKKMTELNNLRTEDQRQKSLVSNIENMRNQLKDIPTGLPDPTQLQIIEAEIAQLDKDHQSQLLEFSGQEKLFELTQLKAQHDQMAEQEQIWMARIGNLQKIRSTLITAEYVILDSVLSQLNLVLSEILGQLFQEPISITLQTLRQLKGNDRIKPEINLEIIFGGAEFGNLNEMSGGEKSRVSLALVIAFSQLGKYPFLLLDECLASLDVVSKEKAISLIKKYLNNKLVIAVNHDTNEGVYDSVIRLN